MRAYIQGRVDLEVKRYLLTSWRETGASLGSEANERGVG
jgi:hypothetical protein